MVGGWHTLIATLVDANSGRPISSELLFSVTGANETSGVDDTDVAGKAFFTHLGAAEGTDTITACVDANGDISCEAEELPATASVTWTAKPHDPMPDPDPDPEPTDAATTTAPTGGAPTHSAAALADTGTAMGSVAASGLICLVVGAAILRLAHRRRIRSDA